MAENTILTADDVRGSARLRSLGVMPGDEITAERKLVRKVSTEPVPQNKQITLEDLRGSARLRSLGVMPGDEISPDRKLVRKFSTEPDEPVEDVSSEDRSFLDNFMYGFDEAGNFVGYLADVLERNFPLGRITSSFEYIEPEQAYGPGFTKAPIDQRKDMILRAKERALVKEYGAQEATGTAATLGEIAGTLADPTVLLPVGQGIRGAAGIGFGIGAGYSAVEDYAKQGEIDPVKALAVGGFSAVTGGTFAGAGQLVGKATRNAANRRITKVENEINERIASGISPGAAFDEVVTPQVGAQLKRDIRLVDRKPKIVASQTRAEQVLQDNIVNDSAVSRLYSKTLDKYLGTLSTRIGNISQPVLRRLRKFEHDVHIDTKKFMDRAEPFMRNLQKLKPNERIVIGKHLSTGKFDEAEAAMTSTEMKQNFAEVRNVLEELYEDSIESGLGIGYTSNYFPRMVKDYDKMASELRFRGKNSIVDKALDDWAKAHNKKIEDLTQAEKTKITNLVLRGYGVGKADAGRPAFSKQRELSPSQLEENNVYEKFYASPEEALSMYIRNSVHNTHRRKFLGQTDKGSPFNLDESIGNVVNKEIEAGRLNPNDEQTLKELISARFIGGEKSTSSGVGVLRDLGYAGTIANPISALTQLGDIGVSMAKYGFRDTIAAMFGTKNLRMVDMGLDRAGQEFADVRKSAQILDKLLGVSGFKAVDRLGKETIMNAALRKNFKTVSTPAGERAFKQKWGKFYGDDIDTLVSHLKSGEVTDRVKEHAFNELSDVQPISSLEMPQVYLESPNGRILYSLKTFTLKQLDVARRDVVQQWKRGNKTQAIKNASALAGYMAASGVAVQTVKDLLLGREVRPDDLPENALWALTGVYGINRYISDKYLSEGNVTEAAVNMIAPATPIIDAVFQAPVELTQEDPNLAKYMRSIPVVGPMLYNWFGGGAEKYNERLRDR